ncbi:DctP family TRAP transporter solute-binding subunit [Maridesulfovibrio sp.]|uniref:DctP family TRAP transporter solute-binding subunit n=1 Tax=Maridesulfovibrio sp. TaxID=2795000 RepID=UPI0029CA9916|nr:DctP family TRAP transporter solute-binding subunit [Maridesulfovibrio sp.]
MFDFKRIFKVAVALTAMVMMMAVSANAAKFKKEYKMQVTVGPKFYWGMGATKFAELVKEKTHGQISIKPYFGSALLKGAQLKSSQMVAKGVIDCAMDSTINISPVIPEANIFHLPFFLNDFESMDKVKFGEAGKSIFQAMEKKRLQPLAWAENGFRQLTNSKELVKKPEDMKGLRIRVVGNPLFIDTFRQLGADPVNMNWGDAVAGFQQGVVDGQENPVGVLIPVQIYQYHKYVTMWNYLADPLIIYWNQREWKAFPKEIQEQIMEAAKEAGRFETALCRAGLDGDKSLNILKNEFNYTMEVPDPIAFMQGKGMEVHTLTPEELKAFEEATLPVYDKWVKKIGPEVYEKAKADMGR